MKLFTKTQHERLLANGTANAERIADDGNVHDFWPVVKLFTPDANATWLLSEIDPEEPDIAFGLCDLGMGSPEALDGMFFEYGTEPLGVPLDKYREQTPDAHIAAKREAGSLPLMELVGRLMAYADEIHGRITDAAPQQTDGEDAA